jgi:trehalose-6-phosphate synthase
MEKAEEFNKLKTYLDKLINETIDEADNDKSECNIMAISDTLRYLRGLISKVRAEEKFFDIS